MVSIPNVWGTINNLVTPGLLAMSFYSLQRLGKVGKLLPYMWKFSSKKVLVNTYNYEIKPTKHFIQDINGASLYC